MRHIATLSMLALLVGCGSPQQAGRDSDITRMIATSLETLADGAACQVGPDDGPLVLAEHGGTAPPIPSSVPHPAEQRQADRGIGGTGAPGTNGRSAMNRLTERGIGGTGIVGVIAGFASICVDGLEVAYDSSATIEIDGRSAAPPALRAGQIVVIQAKGSMAMPLAQTISVRHQVVGRIESIERGTGMLSIAGQAVSVAAGTWGAEIARLGEWIAVSGLRRTNGTLIATRFDQAPVGTLTVRGQVVRDGDSARIGDLVLTGAAGADLNTGQYVLVTGQYTDGRPQVRAVTLDPMFGNPAGYFSAAVNHLVLQGFVRVEDGAVFLNGQKIAAGPGVTGKPGADRVAIVSLERKPDGTFTAVGLRYTDRDGPAPGAIRPPAGTSRGSPAAPPQVRRSTAQMMALTGDGSLTNAGSAVAAAATMREPAGTSPVVTVSSTGTMTSAPATNFVPTVTVADTPPTSAPPGPLISSPPVSIIPPPVETGADMEPPTNSQLISNRTGPTDAIRSAVATAVTFHPAIAAAPSTTVSLSTEAVTTPPAHIGAGSGKTPAALMPSSPKSGGIEPTGMGRRSAARGGAVSQSH